MSDKEDKEFDKIAQQLSEEGRLTKAKANLLTVVGFVGFVCILPTAAVVWTWAIRYVFGV